MSQDNHASKMEVVDSRESRDIRGREHFPSTRTRSWGAREEKKEIQEGRSGEGAKLIRGGESSAREERKREDERASSISPTW